VKYETSALYSGRGETGRRKGLKIPRPKRLCGFEPRRPHHRIDGLSYRLHLVARVPKIQVSKSSVIAREDLDLADERTDRPPSLTPSQTRMITPRTAHSRKLFRHRPGFAGTWLAESRIAMPLEGWIQLRQRYFSKS
jgi:hypothetical protein